MSINQANQTKIRWSAREMDLIYGVLEAVKREHPGRGIYWHVSQAMQQVLPPERWRKKLDGMNTIPPYLRDKALVLYPELVRVKSDLEAEHGPEHSLQKAQAEMVEALFAKRLEQPFQDFTDIYNAVINEVSGGTLQEISSPRYADQDVLGAVKARCTEVLYPKRPLVEEIQDDDESPVDLSAFSSDELLEAYGKALRREVLALVNRPPVTLVQASTDYGTELARLRDELSALAQLRAEVGNLRNDTALLMDAVTSAKPVNAEPESELETPASLGIVESAPPSRHKIKITVGDVVVNKHCDEFERIWSLIPFFRIKLDFVRIFGGRTPEFSNVRYYLVAQNPPAPWRSGLNLLPAGRVFTISSMRDAAQAVVNIIRSECAAHNIVGAQFAELAAAVEKATGIVLKA